MIYPVPKLPRKEQKPRKPIQRTRVKKYRSKPRPGRLKGEDLVQLRRQCFERDNYGCTVCGVRIDWDTGEMAHRGAKRRYGDSLANVTTKCFQCHRIEHQYGPTGLKPVPAKKERTQ